MARYAPFWLVWSPSGNQPPRHQHASEELAEREADRLAQANPGREFYVLEPRSTVCAQKLLKERFFGRDEVPF